MLLDDIFKLSFNMLDVRKLRLLRELHARGTVTAVAEALSYTPSAVSQQIAQLQAEAGVALTERVGRRLHLTDAGVRLVGHTETVLAHLEAAEADLEGAAGVVRGTVRVASLQTPLMSLVPAAHRLLRERHPALRVELLQLEPEAALPAVALGELDASVAEEYAFAPRHVAPGLARDELGSDEVVVALPRDHPAAAETGPIALSTLASEPWACDFEGTHFAQMMETACRLAGFTPDVRHRCDVRILLALVAAGSAVALVPTLPHPERHEGIVVRPVADHELRRTIAVFTRLPARGRPAIAALVDALGDAARDAD